MNNQPNVNIDPTAQTDKIRSGKDQMLYYTEQGLYHGSQEGLGEATYADRFKLGEVRLLTEDDVHPFDCPMSK